MHEILSLVIVFLINHLKKFSGNVQRIFSKFKFAFLNSNSVICSFDKNMSPQTATVKLIFNLSTRLNSKKRWYSETNKIKSRCQLWLLHWLSVVPSAENKVKLIFVNLCVLKGLISKSRVPSNIFNKQPVSQTFYGTSLIFTVFGYFTE